MGESHGMFDLPDAKRPRLEESCESDAGASSASSSSNGQEEGDRVAALRARLRAQVERVLSVDEAAHGPDGETAADEQRPAIEPPPDEEEAAFAFRLFASSTKGGGAPQKVVLAPDDGDAAAGEGGLVVPERPLSHYLASEPTPAEADAFRAAAVSGEDVVRQSAQRCWGLEVPWRVTSVAVTVRQMRALLENGVHLENSAQGALAALTSVVDRVGEEEEAAEAQRKRPGKKRRIALRTREKARLEAERSRREKLEAEERLRASKEEHLKEKKQRLNREKKLKRRQKEREKKSAAKAGDVGAAAEAPS